jgi:hypothetical protein
MKSPGVWHHVYWGNCNFEMNITMSEQLEPNFIEYEAISVLYRNNGDLKQRTSKHTKTPKLLSRVHIYLYGTRDHSDPRCPFSRIWLTPLKGVPLPLVVFQATAQVG